MENKEERHLYRVLKDWKQEHKLECTWLYTVMFYKVEAKVSNHKKKTDHLDFGLMLTKAKRLLSSRLCNYEPPLKAFLVGRGKFQFSCFAEQQKQMVYEGKDGLVLQRCELLSESMCKQLSLRWGCRCTWDAVKPLDFILSAWDWNYSALSLIFSSFLRPVTWGPAMLNWLPMSPWVLGSQEATACWRWFIS